MRALRGRVSASHVAGAASIGAGAVHASAAGAHAAAPSLARLFVAIAAAQLLFGVLLLRRRSHLVAAGTAVVNAAAVAGWAITRVAGISWIEGLEQSETPQLADSVCATLGMLAVVGAFLAMRPTPAGVARGLGVALPSVAIGAVTVAAMLAAVTSVHAHDESAAGQDHGAAAPAEDHHDAAATDTTTANGQVQGGDASTTEGHHGEETTTGADASAHMLSPRQASTTSMRRHWETLRTIVTPSVRATALTVANACVRFCLTAVAKPSIDSSTSQQVGGSPSSVSSEITRGVIAT